MKIHHLITALAVFTCTSAFADDLYWDSNGATAGTGGAGDMTQPGTNIWRNGSSIGTLQAWADGNNAYFGGTASASTTNSSPMSFNQMIFQTNNYTIGLTNAVTISFGGTYSDSTPTIDTTSMTITNPSTTINSKITGPISGGLVIKDGSVTAGTTPGRVYLNAASGSDFTGNITVLSGVLHARSNLGDAANQINLKGGAIMENTAGQYPDITRQVNILADSRIWTLNSTGGSNSLTLSGSITGSANLNRVQTGNSSSVASLLVLAGDMSGFTGNVTNSTPASGNSYLSIATTATSGGGWVLNGGTTTLATSLDDIAIANGAGKKDLVINGGTLDLNGRSEIINGLSGGSGTLQNQAGLTTSTLTLGDGNATASFTGTIRNNTVSGGTLAITKIGSGTQTLLGASVTYTGATAVNNGTLSLSNCTAFASAVTVASPGALELGSSGTWNFGQPIDGTGALTKTGSGSVFLAATCGYGGATDIKAGTLSVLSANTGTGNINVREGATLEVTDSGTQLLPGTLTVGDSTGASVSFSNITSTTTAPVSAGTLALNGTITVTIKSGTFAGGTTYPLISYTTPAGAGTITTGPLPTLPALTTGYVTNNTTLSRIEFVVTSPASVRTWSGSVNGNWDLSTLNWDGGTTAYANSVAVIFDDTATGSTTVTNLVSPSALPFSMVASNITKAYTISGNPIAGTGSLTKTGNGVLTLANTNSYSGGTTVSGGTLRLGDASGRNGVVAGNITDNAVVEFANPAAQTYSSVISGTGALAKSGAGTLTLNTTHSYTNGTTISGGTLQLGDGSSANGVVTGNITNNAALAFANPNDLNFPNIISGTGTVAKSGAGILTLTGTNSYTGATTISSGRVNITKSTSLGTADAGTTVNTGAELHLLSGVTTSEPLNITGNGSGIGALSVDAGASTWNGPVTATGDTVIGFPNSGTLTINGMLTSGSGTLMKIGPNNLTLGGTNSFAGPFTITNGAVIVTNAYALGTNTTVNVIYGSTIGGAGTTLTIYGGVATPTNVTLTLTATNDGANSYRAALQSNGGASNIWNGPILLNGGAGGLTAGYSSATSPLILNGPILGTNTTCPNFYLRGGGPCTVNGWVNMPNATFATTDNNTLAIVKSITNVWAVTAVSYGRLVVGTNNALCTNAPVTFGSATAAQNATLDLAGWSQQVTGLERLGAGTATIGSSSTTQDSLLVFAGGVTPSTYSGTISNAVSGGTRPVAMTVNSGSLTLTGTNAYTGATTVSNGTLAVNGSLASGSAVTVIGGTLGGTGTINGPVTVAGGAFLSPGASIGTLTVSNDLTLNGNLFIEISSTTTNDKCVVSGALAGNGLGTITITNLGAELTGAATFQLFNNLVAGAGSMAINYTGTLPSGYGWTNTLAVDGTVKVVALLNPTPTNITYSVSGGYLNLSWPPDHTGWLLQAQTNSLNAGLGTNWVTVPGAESVNATNFPIIPGNPSVFYRLKLP